MSARQEKLKTRLFEVEFHDPGQWHFQGVNILDEWPQIRDEPMVVRKGYAQKYIGEFLPVVIKPDELIVGVPNQNSVGWGSVLPIYYTSEEGLQAARYELNECSVWGHHPPDWSMILRHGVAGVKDMILAKMREQYGRPTPDRMSLNNYKAMLVALDGLVAFALRYSDEAMNQATRCPTRCAATNCSPFPRTAGTSPWVRPPPFTRRSSRSGSPTAWSTAAANSSLSAAPINTCIRIMKRTSRKED